MSIQSNQPRPSQLPSTGTEANFAKNIPAKNKSMEKQSKRWSLRLLALVLGCLPIILCEVGLRVPGGRRNRLRPTRWLIYIIFSLFLR